MDKFTRIGISASLIVVFFAITITATNNEALNVKETENSDSNPKMHMGPSMGFRTSVVYPVKTNSCTPNNEYCYSFAYVTLPNLTLSTPQKFEIHAEIKSNETKQFEQIDVAMQVTEPSGNIEVISKRIDTETGENTKIHFFYESQHEGKYKMVLEIVPLRNHQDIIFDSWTIETEISSSGFKENVTN